MEKRHQRHQKKNHFWIIINSLLLLACLIAVGILFFTLKNWTKANQTNASTTQAQVTSSSSTEASSEQAAASAENTTSDTVDWVKQETTINFPILMYHAIHVMDASEASSANLIVDPTTFESHISRLAQEGYYFLTPEEAYKVLTENVLPNGNSKIIWLTFDDGDEDFYTIAYPILKKYNAKATNNIITSYVQNGSASNLTVDQMLEMKENGMSFESHTVNHPDLSATDESTQSNELITSKTWLDSMLSQDTIAIAYPSGRYSETTTQLAQSTYKLAVTTNEGLASADDGLLSLDRVRILPTTTADSLMTTISQ